MRITLASALRRAFAALVLFAAVLAAVDAALFKVWHPVWYGPNREPINVDCSRSLCYSTRPGWAIPIAIAIGLVGIVLAALLHRPRSARAVALSGQPAILRDDERQAAVWGLAPPRA